MKYYILFVTILFVCSQIEHAAGECGTQCIIQIVLSPFYAVSACSILCCICCGPPYLIIKLISGKVKSDMDNKVDEEVGGDPIIPGRTYTDNTELYFLES